MTVQRTQGEIFISDLSKDGRIPDMLYWQPRKNIYEAKQKNWMQKHWTLS